MAKVSIEEALNSIHPELVQIFSKDYRETLDTRITILDLSYNALKVNVYRNTDAHIKAFDNAYAILVEVLNDKAKRVYKSLADIPNGYFDSPNAPFIYINGGNDNRFIAAKSFGAIRDFVTKQISRDSRLIRTSFGQNTIVTDVLNKAGVPSGDTKTVTRSKLDIGHIATADSEQLISPLELKISDILTLGQTTKNPIIEEQAKKALEDLYAIQAEFSYSFKNTAPEAINLAQDKLGSMYVVVTLHRQKLNAAFSVKELEIYNRLKATIALKLTKFDIVTSISGSNTIEEDIIQGLTNKIIGTGKLQTHGTKTINKQVALKKTVGIDNAQVSERKQGVGSAPIRTVSGQFYSLASLQQLLNDNLQHVISANMGSGGRKDILNYQTGRFAASITVDRLSQSREGMITAYYNYMKNPYQTFEPGFRQGDVKTRDPKLLIAKSIRELAASKVGNRLRAVLV